MALRELREKYGGTRSRESINRAIRAECPGGDTVLDRLEDWHRILNRLGRGDPAAWGTGREPLHVTAYRHLVEIRADMEEAIRRRYGLPDRTH